MSLSCSGCFSDLLCKEKSSSVLSGDGDDSPEYLSDLESRPSDFAEFITGLFEDERDLASSTFQSSPESIDASSRTASIAWILKVQRYYGFQPLTVYLSVNYFDRYLYSHHLPKMNRWQLQLLSVACLSLAAKMEEPLVPSLLNLQVEGAIFIFEPKHIKRMELLVLSVLGWRLRSIDPFCYLHFFSLKIDPSETYNGFLTSRAKDIFFSTIQESSFLEYKPSCIAAATMLCAANDLPKFSFITAQHAESWSDGLHKDDIMSCYDLIRRFVLKDNLETQMKVQPQLRVVTRVTTTSSDSSSSLSSSSSSSSSYKKRKINNYSWCDDDKTSSD